MWILTSKKTGTIYYLLPEKSKHIVGRNNADLILKDDSSISRSHACLYPTKDHVKVIDTGSKYGTFCNENIENKIGIKKNEEIKLKNGERVQFGLLDNEWTLSKLNICTLTSSINPHQKEELEKYINLIGGEITEIWKNSCTHLTMSEITVTLKVLKALVENVPIVSCEYWKDYYENLKNSKLPPKCENYLPKLAEKFLNKEIVSFHLNEKRKTIFHGKKFVFMNKVHLEKYSSIIECAGGECKNLNKGIQKSFLLDKDVIVIQHVSSSQTQSSQSINMIEDYIKRNGRRLIPDFEIGLAIIHCSVEKYCNPKYDITSGLLPQSSTLSECNILALQTPLNNESSEGIRNTISVEVPESVVYDPEKLSSSSSSQVASNIENIESQKISESIEIEIDDIVKNQNNEDKQFSEKQILFQNIGENSNLNEKSIKRKRSSHERDDTVSIAKKPNQNEGGLQNSNNLNKSQNSSQMININDFLDKSQIRKTNEENVNNSNESASMSLSLQHQQQEINPKKRGKIAVIRDEDDDSDYGDNDNDLFNFGGSNTKRFKPSSQANDFSHEDNENNDGLFSFANKKNTNDKQNNQPSSLELRRNANEGRTLPVNYRNVSNKFVSFNKSNTPVFINCDGWLSKSMNKIEIKSENDIKSEDKLEEKQNDTQLEWINSIRDGFQVRVRPMQLISLSTTRNMNVSGDNNSQNSNTTNGITNTTRKNFKAFVKKQNYKPQKEVAPTVSYRVMCDLSI